MIFEELVLHNFGIYRGRHVIALAPKDSSKPVVLFGALNGGGKTTFLDALQLALYGKFANCSNRGDLSYPEYLRQTINHHVDPKDGAGIELQFRHRQAGNEDTYRVIRTWRSTGKGIKETIEVLRNGKLDPVLTERWYEYVEEFIPGQISSLFFFDGEKIETLASYDKSSELIRTGIHALLGLDLVDRLTKDLIVIENRKKASIKSSQEQKRLDELQRNISDLHERRAALVQQLASERNEHQKITNKINSLQDEFRREGGDIFQQRDAILAERTATKHRLQDTEEKLRELASGAAPLLIVEDLLFAAHEQARLEHEVHLYKELRDILLTRDKELISTVKRNNFDKEFIDVISSFLREDIKQRDCSLSRETYLNIEPHCFAGVSTEFLSDIKYMIGNQLALFEEISEKLSDLDRKLAGIPDPDSLTGITARINDAEKSKDRILIKIEMLENELDALDKQIQSLDNEYRRSLEQAANQQFSDATNKRVIRHSERLRNIFSKFRKHVAERHIAQLEELILDSFRQLIRKSDLISRISIDPTSYALSLYNNKGELLPAERLSAGERQLLAISILWGLAKASGRPLPSVIDTPLGRLDGNHRSHLVKNYFPYASHQVLLLSTDEEIDERYYKDLKRSIGLEYQISYDENALTSTIRPGYFW